MAENNTDKSASAKLLQAAQMTRKASNPIVSRPQSTKVKITSSSATPPSTSSMLYPSLSSSPSPAGPSPVGRSPAGPSPAGPSPAGPSPVGLSHAGPSPAGPSAAGPSHVGPSPAGPSAAGPPTSPSSVISLHTSPALLTPTLLDVLPVIKTSDLQTTASTSPQPADDGDYTKSSPECGVVALDMSARPATELAEPLAHADSDELLVEDGSPAEDDEDDDVEGRLVISESEPEIDNQTEITPQVISVVAVLVQTF